jgi:O-succinylbenzoate synthase
VIRLSRVTLREIHLSLVEPFQTSAGLVEKRRIVLLELCDADGLTMWSECVADALPTYTADTVDTSWLALSEWIVPLALARSFSTPQSVHTELGRTIRGHRMAKAAVEMGVWAMSAAQRGLSLATLLAGESAHAHMPGSGPRESVPTGIALGIHESPEALARRVETAVLKGYQRIKVKIEPDRDVEFAQAAKKVLPPGVSMSVDANCSYSLDNPDHMRSIEMLDQLGLSMIEQPLAHDDLVHHAELQRELNTAICLDESICGEADIKQMLILRSARLVNLKPGRVGGFQQAIAIHDRCASAGVPVWCGGMLESGIGRAYNVALASLPNFTEPGDLSPSARYWERDVVTPPWTMSANGCVRVPLDKPGLGVEIDVGLIDDLTVRRVSFDAK